MANDTEVAPGTETSSGSGAEQLTGGGGEMVTQIVTEVRTVERWGAPPGGRSPAPTTATGLST
jgi:hypothetical protein